MSEVKIIQILSVPECSQWPSCFLGLASDGITYVFEKGEWLEFAPNIKLDKKSGE